MNSSEPGWPRSLSKVPIMPFGAQSRSSKPTGLTPRRYFPSPSLGKGQVQKMLNLLAYADGNHDLLAIAERTRIFMNARRLPKSFSPMDSWKPPVLDWAAGFDRGYRRKQSPYNCPDDDFFCSLSQLRMVAVRDVSMCAYCWPRFFELSASSEAERFVMRWVRRNGALR